MASVYSQPTIKDFFIGCLIAIVLFALYAIAGYVDWTADQAYQQAWAEANGVRYEAS